MKTYIINYISYVPNGIVVGATTEDAWKLDREQGRSGADAFTVFSVLRTYDMVEDQRCRVQSADYIEIQTAIQLESQLRYVAGNLAPDAELRRVWYGVPIYAS